MYLATVGEGFVILETERTKIDKETHETLMNFGGGLSANCGIGSRSKLQSCSPLAQSNCLGLLTTQTRTIYCSPP